ncbi:MAG: hypothetical protein JXA14_16910 [Anaerolineae bacterium]|nr:hypothetical protein [Anaerolineae bacterium]
MTVAHASTGSTACGRFPFAHPVRRSLSGARKKESKSPSRSKIETAAGSTVKVDLPGIGARRESQLGETFPNAEISQAAGLSTGLIIVIVVAGLALLCCLVTYGIPLILRLFAS